MTRRLLEHLHNYAHHRLWVQSGVRLFSCIRKWKSHLNPPIAVIAQLLITGETGFIRSHTWLLLQQTGQRLVTLDNFSNSSPIALERVCQLVGGDL